MGASSYIRSKAIAATIATLALSGPLVEAAQARGYDLPHGPYRSECRNERVEGGYLLRATCPKRNGEMRDSSLDLRTCQRGAPVYNDGAYLRCGSGGGYGGGGGGGYGGGSSGYRDDGYGSRRGGYELPAGPYRYECRNERVEGGYLLRATCPKRNGEMRDASLDLRSCGRGTAIYNDGAYLRCR